MAFSVAVCGGFAEGGPPLDPVSTSGSSAMKESCLDELIRDSLSRPVISIRRVFSFLFFFHSSAHCQENDVTCGTTCRGGV